MGNFNAEIRSREEFDSAKYKIIWQRLRNNIYNNNTAKVKLEKEGKGKKRGVHPSDP